MKETNTSTNNEHVYDLLMRAIMRLPNNEKEFLMEQFTIPQLTYLFSEKEHVNDYINKTVNLLNVIKNLNDNIVKCMNEGDDIASDYNKLNDDEKKEAALKLLNNEDFQKNCCEILVSDMERIVNTDSTAKAINDVFNLTGIYKKLIEQGIGTDHHYEVK